MNEAKMTIGYVKSLHGVQISYKILPNDVLEVVRNRNCLSTGLPLPIYESWDCVDTGCGAATPPDVASLDIAVFFCNIESTAPSSWWSAELLIVSGCFVVVV